MRRVRKKTFADLVRENKQELLENPAAMKELEKRIEARHEIKKLERVK